MARCAGTSGRVPRHLWEPYDAVARLFGLGIDEVHISGIVELRESEVLAAAGVGPLRSLAFLDASEVRKRLNPFR